MIPTEIDGYYTGIGARVAPRYGKLERLIKQISVSLWQPNFHFVCRSGGAEGADSIFGEHCGSLECYLPWRGFNNQEDGIVLTEIAALDEALKMAAKFHPNWKNLKSSVRNLMARNSLQIFGKDMKTPSKLLVCWTPSGKDEGGTAQALRIARHYEIPVFNIRNEKEIAALAVFLHKLYKEKN